MYDQRLIERLLVAQPDTVALVGESVFRLEGELRRVLAQSDNSRAKPAVCKALHLDAYVEDVKARELESASGVMCLDISAQAEDPESVLGLACRVSPRLLLVEQTTTQSSTFLIKDEQFFAFGFRVVEKTDESDVRRTLHAFSLSDYKQAPDWLNARFWAHPERFGLPD